MRSYMQRGQDRIDKELDVATFIERQKISMIAMKTIFTKMERYLMTHDKSFVIDKGYKSRGNDSDELGEWTEGCDWDDRNSAYFMKLLNNT